MFCLAMAFFALAASVPFYAFNRSENVASFHCLEIFRHIPTFLSVGMAESTACLKPITFLDEGLPSGIWCFSWTLVLLVIWGESCCNRAERRVERICWCLIPVVLNTVWEVFQKIEIISGIGTFADIAFGIVGAFTALGIRQMLLFRKKAVL
jgi:hypothetical protein